MQWGKAYGNREKRRFDAFYLCLECSIQYRYATDETG
jgi:hypothetical protein